MQLVSLIGILFTVWRRMEGEVGTEVQLGEQLTGWTDVLRANKRSRISQVPYSWDGYRYRQPPISSNRA